MTVILRLGVAVLVAVPAMAAAQAVEDRPELTPAQEAECRAGGGRVAIGGILGGTFCAKPTPDAGAPCRRASDCTVRCEAETRTCATHFDPFGCHSYLDEAGNPQHICVD